MNEKPRAHARGVKIAHGVWAVIGVAACLPMILIPGGHPPLLIFLPVVMAIWLVGHVAIWIAGRLAARGRRSLPEGIRASRPPLLILALGLTGLATAIGLVQLVVSALMRELYPFRLPGLWAITMAIWIAHGACFAGLLMRKSWSRRLCVVLPLGWAGLLGAQIVDHLARGRPVNPTEMAVALVLMALLVALAWRLAVSPRVREQFADTGSGSGSRSTSDAATD